MKNPLSRRKFLSTASAAAASIPWGIAGTRPTVDFSISEMAPVPSKKIDRIVDMHVHFREKEPNFISDFLKLSDRLNLTACFLTPFANRKVVVEAAKQHPKQIIPFGAVKLDAPDVVKQVEELRELGFRGLGEISSMKKPCSDPSYFPVYELASQYKWILMFHTGIVGRGKFDEPENVASGRMRPIHLEEIARQFPKVTVIGAHLGNPEYEWAGEVARWNPNLYFDLSGTSLPKMRGRLGDFRKIFWWSDVEWEAQTSDDPSPYSKLVFGTDTRLDNIEVVLSQYRALFDACDVPEGTRKMILGGTLAKMLGLPD